jgi:signal transduction histidine kinase
VVSVIREEEATAAYEVSIDEILDAIRSRAGALAEAEKVKLDLRAEADVALPNRTANLVILILTNLLENAIQATPAKGVVRLEARPGGTQLLFELADEGPGFPEEITPFAPCSSTREGGTGIGLALSKQLASHLGAELELARTSAQGCLFTLSLPLPTSASDYPAVIAAAT